MSGDGLLWIVLFSILIILNIIAINLYKKRKLPLWISGLSISILGPVLAFITGYFFVKIDHSTGGTGEGGGIAAAFLGLVIVTNGIIYLMISIIFKVKHFFNKRNVNQ
ncbi:MAG: ABC transporter permease [Bacillus sp. (in: firmicutes)]